MLFENWKHSPCHRAKIWPEKVGFSAFFSHGKLKLVMKKSLHLLPKFCVNPDVGLVFRHSVGKLKIRHTYR